MVCRSWYLRLNSEIHKNTIEITKRYILRYVENSRLNRQERKEDIKLYNINKKINERHIPIAITIQNNISIKNKWYRTESIL